MRTMSEQEGVMNRDKKGRLTTSYFDGTQWYTIVKLKDGEALTGGSSREPFPENIELETLVFSWGNGMPAKTQRKRDLWIHHPWTPEDFEQWILCENPSFVTDLTLRVYNAYSIPGRGKYFELLATFKIPKAIDPYTYNKWAFYVPYLLQGTNGFALIVENDTDLGTTDGFTAHISLVYKQRT